MKRSIILSIFLFISAMIAKKTHAEKNTDSSECLIVSGNIEAFQDYSETDISKNYKVELIYFNTLIDSVIKKDNRSFKFALKRNSIYTLRITKAGYIPKLISINTFLEDNNNALYQFHFETDMMKEGTKGVFDKEALEFPIALIGFYKDDKAFNFNKEYTSNIKKSLYLVSQK